MLLNDADGVTSHELNVETAAPAFEAYLSEEEKRDDPESPPTQSPESEQSEPVADEASPEPAETEPDESAETEQTEEEQAEAPEAVLDPNLSVMVKIDGVEQKVTLEEALKGYSRTQDYTRKTQEVAEHRKVIEAERSMLRERAQQYATQMTQLEQVLRDTTPEEPDWAQVQRDQPAKFPELWAQWSAHKERMGQIQAERYQAEQVVAHEQAQVRAQHLQAEQERLLAVLPEWRNPEKAKTAQTQMVAYVKELGYSPEEIGQVTDHRLLVMIDKAMRWDAAQKNKPAIQQRIEKVRVATPGPASGARKPSVPESQKARERLAKTGRQDDAAAAFESFLED